MSGCAFEKCSEYYHGLEAFYGNKLSNKDRFKNNFTRESRGITIVVSLCMLISNSNNNVDHSVLPDLVFATLSKFLSSTSCSASY